MTDPAVQSRKETGSWSAPRPVLILCLALIIAGYLGLVAGQASHFGGNISGLICLGDHFVTPEDVHPGAIIYQNSIGYDGQFFYFIALDPMMDGRGPELMKRDAAAYRYTRILYPLLAAWFAQGRAELFPATLVAMNLLGVILGCLFAGLLARRNGLGEWWSLAWAVTAGLALGVLRDLAEPLALGLAMGWLYFHLDRKWIWASVMLALSLLTRETVVILAAPLAAYGLFRERDWRPAAAVAAAGLPLACWVLFIHSRLGVWPVGGGTGNIGIPLAGMISYGRTILTDGLSGPSEWFGAISLIMTGAAIVLAVREVVKRNTDLSWALLTAAVFFSTMNTRVWVEPWSYGRVLLPLNLMVLTVFLTTRDRLFLPLLAGQAALMWLVLVWQRIT